MGEVLLAMLGPTVAFGFFAFLAVRYGAESRPYFDERPVLDDRPNWFPIVRSVPDDDEGEDDDDVDGGLPEPVPEAGPEPRRRQPLAPAAALASRSSAATSPSGV